MNQWCAINEILIQIMGTLVKRECIAMHKAGASIEQMNEALATTIIPKAEGWRAAMLVKIMNVMGEANAPDSVSNEWPNDMPSHSIN
jgi:hypothetical protein